MYGMTRHILRWRIIVVWMRNVDLKGREVVVYMVDTNTKGQRILIARMLEKKP